MEADTAIHSLHGTSSSAQPHSNKAVKVLLYTPAFYPKVDGIVRRIDNFLHCVDDLNRCHGDQDQDVGSDGVVEDPGDAVGGEKIVFDFLIVCPRVPLTETSTPSPDHSITSSTSSTSEHFLAFQIHRVPSFAPNSALAPLTRLANPFYVTELQRVMETYQPDLVHFIGPDFYVITGLWARWWSRLKERMRRGIWSVFGRADDDGGNGVENGTGKGDVWNRVPFLVGYHQHNQEWVKHQPMCWPLKFILKHVFKLEKCIRFADAVMAPSVAIQTYLGEEVGVKCGFVWDHAVDSLMFRPAFELVSKPGPNDDDDDGNANNNVNKKFRFESGEEFRKEVTFGHPDWDRVPILLYVGRMAHEKSINWILYVLEHLPTAYCALIGSGALDTHLRTLHGPQTRLWFSDGFLSGWDLSVSYASSDVFLLPSSFETLGNVCLEAMASGCCVVARNKGGVVDVVRPGMGWLVETDEPSSMLGKVKLLLESRERWIDSFETETGHAERIRKLLESDDFEDEKKMELYPRLVRNGYRYAKSKSWMSSTKGVLEVYRELIAEKSEYA